MTKKKNAVPVTEDQRYQRLLMIGLGAAIAFLIAGQVLMLAVLPAMPLYGEIILNTALALNILVIPAVALIVYAAVQRFLANRF